MKKPELLTPRLAVVIPCYNEEAVLPETSGIFLTKITTLIKRKKISNGSKILFVDDGSNDKTWSIICGLAEKIIIILAFAKVAIVVIKTQS